MTDKQIKYVSRLLERASLLCNTEELALQYSNNRTAVLINLNQAETQNLIDFLNGQERSPKDKMKGKILSMAHEMHWELPSGKIDFNRLNAWCKKSTPSHKAFDDLTTRELPVVVSIFEKMYKDYLKTL